MRILAITVLLLYLSVPAFSDTVYYRKDVKFPVRSSKEDYSLTSKAKTKLLLNEKLTKTDVKRILGVSGNTAKKVISELLKENEIYEKDVLYNIQYPPADILSAEYTS